jgi:hypothetical protein
MHQGCLIGHGTLSQLIQRCCKIQITHEYLSLVQSEIGDGHDILNCTVQIVLLTLTTPITDEPASCGNSSTIGFAAASPEAVDSWHKAGLAAGGASFEDPPGIRENVGGKLYLAYSRDPSGNKICALHRVG